MKELLTINDNVFGELHYDHSWVKEESLTIGNEEHLINVVVEAYEEQGISDIQRNQYLAYQQRASEIISDLPKVLLEYYLEHYDEIASEVEIPEQVDRGNINEQLIMKLVRIKDIYFARSGSYGFLCDCAWDEEHGICVLLSRDNPCVVEQDALI